MRSLIPMLAALIAFVVAAVLGVPVVKMLRRLNFGQTIREEGPQWHKSKQGTPTMGGVLIVSGLAIAVVTAFCLSRIFETDAFLELKNVLGATKLIGGLGLALSMGIIGFLDDYIKVVKKRNLGLTAMQKTVLQSAAVAIYLGALAFAGLKVTWLPFIGYVNITSGLGLIFWPIAFFFVYGFTNAVNLTDGVDGLASSVTLVAACGFLLMSGFLGFDGCNILSASLAGACIGFLVWNWNPAKMFMGDTGSMFLGGMVVALSFCIDRPVILLLAGIVYLIEALSVILQVVYFKKTGKRLFKMSPIHHHFEKSGWSEVKIVIVFSLVTLVACGLCFALII